MNFIKIAESIAARSLYLPQNLKEEQIIALKHGYYSNSGLDMAQFEETRSADCYVYLDGDEVKGYADWRVSAAMKEKNVKKDEHKVFGKITNGNLMSMASTIDSWAKNLMVHMDVDKYTKKDWEGPVDRRRRPILKFLAEKYNAYAQKEVHPAMNVDNPPHLPPPSNPIVDKNAQIKKDYASKVNLELRSMETTYGILRNGAFELYPINEQASEDFNEAATMIIKAKDKINKAIAELEK